MIHPHTDIHTYDWDLPYCRGSLQVAETQRLRRRTDHVNNHSRLHTFRILPRIRLRRRRRFIRILRFPTSPVALLELHFQISEQTHLHLLVWEIWVFLNYRLTPGLDLVFLLLASMGDKRTRPFDCWFSSTQIMSELSRQYSGGQLCDLLSR